MCRENEENPRFTQYAKRTHTRKRPLDFFPPAGDPSGGRVGPSSCRQPVQNKPCSISNGAWIANGLRPPLRRPPLPTTDPLPTTGSKESSGVLRSPVGGEPRRHDEPARSLWKPWHSAPVSREWRSARVSPRRNRRGCFVPPVAPLTVKTEKKSPPSRFSHIVRPTHESPTKSRKRGHRGARRPLKGPSPALPLPHLVWRKRPSCSTATRRAGGCRAAL